MRNLFLLAALACALAGVASGCSGKKSASDNSALQTSSPAKSAVRSTPAANVTRLANGTAVTRLDNGTVVVVPSGGDDTPIPFNSPDANGTPNSSGTPSIGETSTSGTPAPGQTPEAATPVSTPTAIPTVAAGDIATVTLDSHPDTPAIEHDSLTVAVGSTFQVGVVVHQPPQPYKGYEYGLHWDEPVLSFVSEDQTHPDDMSLCPDLVHLDFTVGVYSGCLRVSGLTSFEGTVATVTMRCESPGVSPLRMFSLAEAQGFGAALLLDGGVEIASEIDPGFTVTCQ